MKFTFFITLILASSISIASNFTPMSNFTPTELNSYEEADTIFQTLNKKTKMFSQCFNRAHIWAKQMHKNYNIDSMKILIFYTDKFRREVNDRWWFHIAPMVSINGENYVMDRGFTSHPVKEEEWEQIFTEQKGDRGIKCARINNYSEYEANRSSESEYCYILHTSMYYWQPMSMEQSEVNQQIIDTWNDSDLRTAAREAFKRWRSVLRDL